MPDPNYPFLGVHFTRRIDGHIDLGPNAVLAMSREVYLRRDISPRDLWNTLRWPGFQKLARTHWKMGISEDFRIHRLGRVLAVRNAPSPAATPSLAIAE